MLHFIFTEGDFYLDVQSVIDVTDKDEWQEQFATDKYRALYRMGFEDKPMELTATGNFLYLVADSFMKALTSLPELELAREKAEVRAATETVDFLLKALPFAIGAEYITEKWIDGIFRKLLEIYSEEILQYSGTVEMYLTEKSQRLHVPERVFFHLVESKDEDYPFAFLATYATRGADGKV